jgi:hypothetical protein
MVLSAIDNMLFYIDLQEEVNFGPEKNELLDPSLETSNATLQEISDKILILHNSIQIGEDNNELIKNELIAYHQLIRQEHDSFLNSSQIYFDTHFSDFPHLMDRSFRSIAHWTIQNASIEYLREKDRIRHRVSKRIINTLEFNRLYSDKLVAEWEKKEIDLSSKILKNLFSADTPQKLDELFIYNDNYFYEKPSHDQNIIKRDPKKIVLLDDKPIEIHDKEEALIKQFLALHADDLQEDFERGDLRQTLMNFLKENPISILYTPNKIQEAFYKWYDWEEDNGVSKERRKLNQKWLTLFLKYLHDRNYVSSMPRMKHRLEGMFQNVVKNFSDIKTVLSLAQVLISILILFGATVLVEWNIDKPVSEIAYQVDLIIFGGLISAGVITAPIFGSIVINRILTTQEGIKALSLIFALSIGSWLFWPAFEWLSISRFIIAIGFIAYLTGFAENLVINTQKLLGLSLISAWLITSILFVFIPANFVLSSIPVLAFSLLVMGFICWYHKFSQKEFLLLSTFVEGNIEMKETNFPTITKVSGSVGAKPHIYSLLFSFIVIELLNLFSLISSGTNFLIAIAIYFFTLVLLTFNTLKLRFSSKLWKNKLLKTRQIFVKREFNNNRYVELDLNPLLNRCFKSTLLKELGFQLFFFTIVIFLFWMQFFSDTNYPLSLIILSLSFVVGERLYHLSIELYNLVISRLPVSQEIIDLSNIKAPDRRTLKERIKDFFSPTNKLTKTFRLLIAFGTIIRFIIEIYEMWPFH